MKIREWDPVDTVEASPRTIEFERSETLTPHRLVELYADDVWRFVSSRLKSREDAEDAAMDVFASAMKAFARLAKAQSPRLWLLAIARNRVNDVLRRQYRRREGPLHEDLPAREAPGSLREPLLDVLSELPDLHREVLVLKYVNGLDTEEVARVIRKSFGATNSLLQRARNSLRERARPLIEAQGGAL